MDYSKFLLLGSFLSFCFNFLGVENNNQVNQSLNNRTQDSLALIALYHATNGENWTNNRNWLSHQPIEEWFGISTDEIGRVTCIDLDGYEEDDEFECDKIYGCTLFGNNLVGSLPEALGKLTKLSNLDLSGNRINGSIPESIGDLSALKIFRLSKNLISGNIPQSMEKLTNLQVIFLAHNKLEGTIPDIFKTMTDLRILDLSRNKLSGSLPTSLNQLSKLELFYLSGNSMGLLK